MLNDSTFRSHKRADTASDVQSLRVRATGTDGGGAGSVKQFFTIAYDFETFAKSATESGINVADRALPVSLTLDRTAIADMTDDANAALDEGNSGYDEDNPRGAESLYYILKV